MEKLVETLSISPAVRIAAITAAARAVADFGTADAAELTETGWSRHGEGRWQLVLHQR